MKRTKYCGLFSESDIGKTVVACGWTSTKRDMGGVIFLDLTDREGTLQVVLDAAKIPEAQFKTAEELRSQSVIEVEGIIRLRAADTVNEKLSTGKIELLAAHLRLLSMAAPLPYPIEDGDSVREDLRLKYRYLDLRRHGLQENLKLRHRILRAARDYLDEAGFMEVETPMLTKSTPEGARDYLVPSRVHPGSFYALPQSPQIFKQLLMVGGIDRYYQVARCFRDEDLRADRQPEFTQVDMEMSFVEQEDVLVHLEGLFKRIAKEVCGLEFPEPFERITWNEAMDKYGSDKPDLRFAMPITDITEIAAGCSFTVFSGAVKKGGVMASSHVGGLSGAFIPVTEDAGMIAAAQSGCLRIEKLEAMMARQSAPEGSTLDDQVALLEKSYELAAKYMPAGQGEASQAAATGKPEQKPSRNGKAVAVPVNQVAVNVVSALAQPMDDTEFMRTHAAERNYGFNTAVGNTGAAEKNTIAACVHGNQTVTDGQSVRLRLLEATDVGRVRVPRNTLVVGAARVQGERLGVEITSLEYRGSIIPVELSVFDSDGQEGIFIPNSLEVSAVKEIAANMGSSLGSSINISTDAGAQLASDLGKGVIQGTSQYIAQKMRTVKVHLKAGYKVMLYQPEN